MDRTFYAAFKIVRKDYICKLERSGRVLKTGLLEGNGEVYEFTDGGQAACHRPFKYPRESVTRKITPLRMREIDAENLSLPLN